MSKLCCLGQVSFTPQGDHTSGHLHDGKQFSSLDAPRLEYGTAIPGAHPGAKTMLALSRNFLRLVCPFRHYIILFRVFILLLRAHAQTLTPQTHSPRDAHMLGYIWQQRQETCPLDGGRQGALVPGTGAGFTPRLYLAAV